MKQLTTPRNPDALQQRKKMYRTYRWQKQRAAYLKAHPWCEMCRANGKLVKAKVLDHALGHGPGWEARFWIGPFTPLCAPCHAIKTEQELRPEIKRPWRICS